MFHHISRLCKLADWLWLGGGSKLVLGAANASPPRQMWLVDHVWESGGRTRPIARLSSALSTPHSLKCCFVLGRRDKGHKTDIRFLSVQRSHSWLWSWSCCPVYPFIIIILSWSVGDCSQWGSSSFVLHQNVPLKVKLAQSEGQKQDFIRISDGIVDDLLPSDPARQPWHNSPRQLPLGGHCLVSSYG